jgi:hypothetical protein
MPEEPEDKPLTELERMYLPTMSVWSENKPKSELNESAKKGEEIEKTNELSSSKKRKAHSSGHDVEKLILIFVAMGILICLVGGVLMLLASFVTGSICLLAGIIIIIIGVLAPIGY